MKLKNAADSYVQLGHLTCLSAGGITTIPVAIGVQPLVRRDVSFGYLFLT